MYTNESNADSSVYYSGIINTTAYHGNGHKH